MPLSTIYPGNPIQSDLYNALDFFGQSQRDEQFKTAQRNNQINQDAALQDYLFNQQNNPLKLRNQELVNQTTEADLARVRAAATLEGHKAEISSKTLQDQILAKRTELAKSISDNDLAQAEAGIKRMMVSTRPEVRAQGEALYGHMYEIKKLRELLQNHIDVANIGAQAGVDRAKVMATKPAGGEKIPKTTRELMTYYDRKRDEADTPEEKDKWNALAEAQWEKIQQEAILKAGAAGAGKVDPSRLPGAGIPTNPMPTPTPNPRPGNNPNAASPNPSSAADRRIRVISPDGKVGTIPASQLKDAQARGYKVTQ